MAIIDEETVLKAVKVGAAIGSAISRLSSFPPTLGSFVTFSPSANFSFRGRLFQPASQTNNVAKPSNNNNSYSSVHSQIYNP